MVQRQKLELQVNRPVEIELLYNEPVVGENQYGVYALYAVKSGDVEYAFFPPKEVDESLRELKAGDKAVITKIAAQRGNKIVAKYDVAINGKSVSKADSSPKNVGTSPRREETSVQKDIPADNYYELMLQSYKDAIRIMNELNNMSDPSRIAITLFIQRTKNGNSNNSFNF
jgi:hypothetical protein